MVLGIGYTLRIRKRSSCLHKDSYMAQRKERTLGYEGRYRRTLSPSGLGNNTPSKSSMESVTPGASDAVGTPRSVSNLTSGKLDTTLSPSAWEKFHNIRPPSTTVIFTSNELAKGASSPTSSSTPSTSGSPQPPSSQPLFYRSISCDSNIFNNKTGATQSTIPPPVAQVAPLRGSNAISSSNGVENSFDKFCHISMRNDGVQMASSPASGSCDNDRCGRQLQSLAHEPTTNTGAVNSDIDKDEKYFRDAICHSLENRKNEHGDQEPSRNSAANFSNSALPSVIVPPLQHEKYEKEPRGCRLSLNPQQYSTETTFLKKSEVSLRVNCTSEQSTQRDVNRRTENGLAPAGFALYSFSTDSDATTSSEECSMNKGKDPSSVSNASNSTASFYTGRQKTQEELECEELSRDIAKLLPQGDKLQTLLVPLPDHKTTADYMEGLFHLELKLQPETMDRRGSQSMCSTAELATTEAENANSSEEFPSQNQKTNQVSSYMETVVSDNKGSKMNADHNSHNGSETKGTSSTPGSTSVVASSDPQENANEEQKAKKSSPPGSYRRCNGHAPLPADSAYFTTSESKAKFLTQYNNDIKKDPINGTDSSEDLDKQKEELVSRISRKLEILRTEQLALREEIQSNEQLGQMVVERVKQTAKRNEFDKFKLHVEEIEKITSLLLGISGRLARAENALMGLSDPPNPQEKKILESKRDKLREQLDEAKILKENIDRRSAQVSSFLQKYLTAEEYADYDHFVKMKAKLIIDAREIDDKIKLGEEQLGALKDALSTGLPLSPNVAT